MATYTEDQLKLYFQHINYPKTTHPIDQLEFLKGLQRHHLCRVPFDSVALHYSPHRLLSLDPEDLFQKIVVKSRGGYCMEVNTFFAMVLRSLGFAVYSAGARVKHERWDHMVNLVTIGGRKYLVDVGFGSREPTEPVPLVHGYEYVNIAPRKGRLEFKHLSRYAEADDLAQGMWVYSARKDDGAEWEEMYSFTEMEFFHEDFEMMNYFVMTRPQSYFVQTVIAYRAVMDVEAGELVGELILHKDKVKQGETQGDHALELLSSEEDRVKALERYFSICLTEREKSSIEGLPTELK
ncbi:Arylamine N-acetyltransferase 1 [Cytospora mali]|uniref:Arylamine N-acetyltransferase 1 n=1 Tax=Cytospora mali TaxID=578113 RepID=A0A194UN57_CYTMA|nr:Arylamine N-acetyltransferase 1 [Valsa mali var. pyri (nom. inval.)]